MRGIDASHLLLCNEAEMVLKLRRDDQVLKPSAGVEVSSDDCQGHQERRSDRRQHGKLVLLDQHQEWRP